MQISPMMMMSLSLIFLVFLVANVLSDDDFSSFNSSSPSSSYLTFSKTITVNNASEHRKLAAGTNDLGFDVYRRLHDYVISKMKEVLEANKNYRNRQPFPHMVTEDLFPLEVLKAVAEEIPDDPELQSEGCAVGSQKCFKTKTERNKNAFDDEEHHGPVTATLFAFMKSSSFIQFLEKLTGIEDLIPDPHYRGSGIHQTLPNGYLNVHADFNRYKRYDLHRRVNILLYLNPDWQEEYGGHLELWSRDMKSCMVRTAPNLGKMTVFSSTDFSYHGHPNPLTCPKNRSRRSLALYYYTKSRPSSECVYGNCDSAHSTLFQKPPCRCEDKKCAKYLTFSQK